MPRSNEVVLCACASRPALWSESRSLQHSVENSSCHTHRIQLWKCLFRDNSAIAVYPESRSRFPADMRTIHSNLETTTILDDEWMNELGREANTSTKKTDAWGTPKLTAGCWLYSDPLRYNREVLLLHHYELLRCIACITVAIVLDFIVYWMIARPLWHLIWVIGFRSNG